MVGDGEEDALLRLRWVVQKRVPAPPRPPLQSLYHRPLPWQGRERGEQVRSVIDWGDSESWGGGRWGGGATHWRWGGMAGGSLMYSSGSTGGQE